MNYVEQQSHENSKQLLEPQRLQKLREHPERHVLLELHGITMQEPHPMGYSHILAI